MSSPSSPSRSFLAALFSGSLGNRALYRKSEGMYHLANCSLSRIGGLASGRNPGVVQNAVFSSLSFCLPVLISSLLLFSSLSSSVSSHSAPFLMPSFLPTPKHDTKLRKVALKARSISPRAFPQTPLRILKYLTVTRRRLIVSNNRFTSTYLAYSLIQYP